MKGIVGRTAVSVGRLAGTGPRRTTGAATPPPPALRTWIAARLRPGAAVSYAVDRRR